MNPPIITLSFVCTKARVETLPRRTGTMGGSAQYLPPVLNAREPVPPPQTIISLSIHTAVCECRPLGAWVVLVVVQLSVLGLYLPPVLKRLVA